jgi:hypothetical protein
VYTSALRSGLLRNCKLWPHDNPVHGGDYPMISLKSSFYGSNILFMAINGYIYGYVQYPISTNHAGLAFRLEPNSSCFALRHAKKSKGHTR